MGPSIWQLLIILLIVVFIFGAKRLRNLGSDLGASIKGFRSAMKEEPPKDDEADEMGQHGRIIDGETHTEARRSESQDKTQA